jgi:hypothetical protein
MKKINSGVLLIIAMGVVFLMSCGDDNTKSITIAPGQIDVSILAEKFYSGATTVAISESTITITSTGEPDHKSMYWSTNNALYENYDEPDNADFNRNPNDISAQNYEFKIPRYPAEASVKSTTSLGAMGVSLNGVPFFNQNAGPGDDILEELNTFDQYEGHPQQTGQYHYHIEPLYLTETLGNDIFLGFLLDGFPVYGPVEGGVTLTNDDLDDYHGHTSVTTDFPDGIYHYHITSELPWINGDGFFGAAGTVTN